MNDYVVIDFETGGLDTETSALVSVGMVVLDGKTLETKDEFYSLIQDDPDKIINPDALAVNKITLEEIASQGKPIAEILATISKTLDGNIIVAHNAAFDIGFLKVRGFAYDHAIDTMDLSWKCWPYQKSKLGIVCSRLGIQVENAHNSLGDAQMTAKLLRYFAEIDVKKELMIPQPINFDRWKRI